MCNLRTACFENCCFFLWQIRYANFIIFCLQFLFFFRRSCDLHCLYLFIPNFTFCYNFFQLPTHQIVLLLCNIKMFKCFVFFLVFVQNSICNLCCLGILFQCILNKTSFSFCYIFLVRRTGDLPLYSVPIPTAC